MDNYHLVGGVLNRCEELHILGYNIGSKPAKPLSLGHAPLWRVVKAGGSEGDVSLRRSLRFSHGESIRRAVG
ncbi:MAG TPA: hypothetical protein VJ327_09520, partial [Patescibacteria group bacterium]|nr:hypothetical protein [Patescibacteria group bacterium]